MNEIKQATAAAVAELLEQANLKAGDLLVVGCSSSEIAGGVIGHDSSLACAEAVVDAMLPMLKEKGIFLAAQCCEHLNRALILEEDYAKTHGLEAVNVLPQPKAGGSFATTCYERFSSPVAVEWVKADAGLDIGDTLIGMHLKAVAVPVRLQTKTIGHARVNAARTRAKFIGGSRAHYVE